MQLFATLSPATNPATLTERYRPREISEFIGLDKPKRICTKLAASPYDCALLFVGEPGLGKTTLALALADAIPAELHHIASQDCTIDNLRRVIDACHYVPREGKRKHLVLVDEADQASKAAQLHLLSKLDSTGRIPDTIWVFTCNSADALEERFVSRCNRVEFSAYGNSKLAAEMLERVWTSEAPADADRPDFARIVKNATGNVRTSLMTLQNELLLA